MSCKKSGKKQAINVQEYIFVSMLNINLLKPKKYKVDT